MGKADTTRENLLVAAREAMWRRGYANVGLREIAREAGVDVALVSRYFGGKRGLFEATLAGAFDLDGLFDDPGGDPVEIIARAISVPVSGVTAPDPLRLLIMNATDAEVGPTLRAVFEAGFLTRFRATLDGPEAHARAALFTAVLLGLVLARKSLGLPGMADADPEEILCQNRYALTAALAYPGGQAGAGQG
jgi:AcrR family transcriptional regulator